MNEPMTTEELAALSNKSLLVRLAVSVAVLEERTEALPELYQQVAKNQTDIVWLKRLVGGGLGSIGIIATGFGVILRFFSGGQ